jgi:hypothetical protein
MSESPEDFEPPRGFGPVEEVLAILFLLSPFIGVAVLFGLKMFGNPLIPFLEWVNALEGGWSP